MYSEDVWFRPLRLQSSKETFAAPTAAMPPKRGCVIKTAVSNFTGQAKYSSDRRSICVALLQATVLKGNL